MLSRRSLLTSSGFIAIIVVAGTGAPVAAQDAAKGAALMAEARQAIGGQERLRAVKTLDVRGDFRRALGQVNMEGELQIRLDIADKLRRDEDLSPPGGGPAIVRTEVLNGTTMWEENSGRGGFIERFGRGDGRRGRQGGGQSGEQGGGPGGPGGGRGRAAMDPAAREEAQRSARQTELARFLLVWLLAADTPAAWVGTAESPDGKADVLEIPMKHGPVTRLFLDQSSHMPLMITWRGAGPQLFFRSVRGRGPGRGDDPPAGGAPQEQPAREEATLRMTLGDYKTVDGIKLPHLITRGINEMTIEEWTIDSYRINPTFKSDVFTK